MRKEERSLEGTHEWKPASGWTYGRSEAAFWLATECEETV